MSTLSSSKRRGVLTLELVLIFPILMLLFVMFYQVSVMLLTYHSLQTTACHAAAAASSATTKSELLAVVETTIKRGIRNWYYEPVSPNTLNRSSNKTEWNNVTGLTYRVLEKEHGATQWDYVTNDSLSRKALVMVEIKFPKLNKQGFWLLPQFKAVDEPTEDDFIVSALGR